MFPILLPIGVLFLGGLAYRKAAKKESTKIGAEDITGLTAEHAHVYQAALKKLEDPAKLATLASAFREYGYEPQAVMLEKRARLRSLPAETKKARRV